jgi:hypothetical protein
MLSGPLREMGYTDDEMLDHMIGPGAEMPEFPPGLSFTMDKATLEQIAEGEAAPGAMLNFAAMGTVLSVTRDRREGCRIELELTMFAGPDGKFEALEGAPSICLCDGECEKLDLDDSCEKGDLLHLMGMARVERTNDPQFGDGTVTMQVTHLACVENESEEW